MGSTSVRITPTPFPNQGVDCSLSCGNLFVFLLCLWCTWCSCFIVFGCQYQCNWLPGKTRLWNHLLCVEYDIKPYTFTRGLIKQIIYWLLFCQRKQTQLTNHSSSKLADFLIGNLYISTSSDRISWLKIVRFLCRTTDFIGQKIGLRNHPVFFFLHLTSAYCLNTIVRADEKVVRTTLRLPFWWYFVCLILLEINAENVPVSEAQCSSSSRDNKCFSKKPIPPYGPCWRP